MGFWCHFISSYSTATALLKAPTSSSVYFSWTLAVKLQWPFHFFPKHDTPWPITLSHYFVEIDASDIVGGAVFSQCSPIDQKLESGDIGWRKPNSPFMWPALSLSRWAFFITWFTSFLYYHPVSKNEPNPLLAVQANQRDSRPWPNLSYFLSGHCWNLGRWMNCQSPPPTFISRELSW